MTLAFGQTTPDPVRLVHLQGVSSAGHHRRAIQADGLRGGLPPKARRPPFTLGMEEVRTGHSPARGVELPVPFVGIRPGKAPGIGHGVAHLRCSPPPMAGNWASTGGSPHRGGFLTRSGRICTDIDAAVIKTVGPIGRRFKSMKAIFQDRSHRLRSPESWRVALDEALTDRCSCPFGRSLAVMNGLSHRPIQLLAPRSGVPWGLPLGRALYTQLRNGYTKSERSQNAKTLTRITSQIASKRNKAVPTEGLQRVSPGRGALRGLSLSADGECGITEFGENTSAVVGR